MKRVLPSTLLLAWLTSGTDVAAQDRPDRGETALFPDVTTASPVPPAWPSPHTSSAPWPYVVIGGGFLLLGILVMRLRDRGGPSFDDAPTIDVLATRTLTAKTRVMLVEAKGREMLLSVTDRGAELLSEWLEDDPVDNPLPLGSSPWPPDDDETVRFDISRETTPAPASSPTTRPIPGSSAGPESPIPGPTESEAIQGLLELRKNPAPAGKATPPWTRLHRRRR